MLNYTEEKEQRNKLTEEIENDRKKRGEKRKRERANEGEWKVGG